MCKWIPILLMLPLHGAFVSAFTGSALIGSCHNCRLQQGPTTTSMLASPSAAAASSASSSSSLTLWESLNFRTLDSRRRQRHHNSRVRVHVLGATAAAEDGGGEEKAAEGEKKEVPVAAATATTVTVTAERETDWKAIASYASATFVQWNLIMAFLRLSDSLLLPRLAKSVSPMVLKGVVAAFFAFMSVRSRVFSCLDNSRPATRDVKKGIVTPSWMPPGKVFPIVWSIIGLLRCISSTMVWETLGRTLCNRPIGAMMLHLSIGDTFNTINSVEKRRGAAVSAVFTVWVSVVAACYTYFQTNKIAGWVILPSVIWITVANALIYSLWSLNGKEPLYPYKLKGAEGGITPAP